MDRVDALGDRPDRHEAFSPALLTETEDEELQQIVVQAAREAGAPIALVSLVLDHIQFFKAHYGLPPELAMSRASRRDVSFCQFVVRDGQTLEVNDAAEDSRLPQYLVREYGVCAYLGIPIRVADTVVGSLCVLDTKARPFSEEQRQSLARLATSVNARLTALAESRQRGRLTLAERATGPALAELRESLRPVESALNAGLLAVPAVRQWLRLSSCAASAEASGSEATSGSLEIAVEALEAIEDAFHDIEVALADSRDCVVALEGLHTAGPRARLSVLLAAAQDLARHSTRAAGGAALPDLAADPLIAVPRPLAVATLGNALIELGNLVSADPAVRSIVVSVQQQPQSARVRITAAGLGAAAAEEVVERLARHLVSDPTLALGTCEHGVTISLATAEG